MTNCPYCGSENSDSAKYCINCGKTFEISQCQNCGHINLIYAKFCELCGKNLLNNRTSGPKDTLENAKNNDKNPETPKKPIILNKEPEKNTEIKQPKGSKNKILIIFGIWIFLMLIWIFVVLPIIHQNNINCPVPADCCEGTCIQSCASNNGFYQEYPYTLNGTIGLIKVKLYPGMYNYSVCKAEFYQGNSESRIKSFINDEYQKRFLTEFINSIKSQTSNSDDQARIAISLVQNIPYDYARADKNKAMAYTLYARYPYQTLCNNHAICSEKSILLALLLKELGYGVVVFQFPDDMHDAVGIKAPYQFSYKNTGYAFVETTVPSIITYSNGLSSNYTIIKVCDGKTLNDISEEWNDAKGFDKLLKNANINKAASLSIVNKYGLKIDCLTSSFSLIEYCDEYNMYGECVLFKRTKFNTCPYGAVIDPNRVIPRYR